MTVTQTGKVVVTFSATTHDGFDDVDFTMVGVRSVDPETDTACPDCTEDSDKPRMCDAHAVEQAIQDSGLECWFPKADYPELYVNRGTTVTVTVTGHMVWEHINNCNGEDWDSWFETDEVHTESQDGSKEAP